MAKIRLVGISEYAKKKGVSRTTIWRYLKRSELDYYVVPGSKKRWLRLKRPNFKEMESNVLDQLLSVSS
ncbi:MAG TPA: hypothetical protein VMW41_00575 [Candidatus Bathyarchaeia archaeon]|nr:hypothetical protein [Candidatus Bathyarchaeia archaeon]